MLGGTDIVIGLPFTFEPKLDEDGLPTNTAEIDRESGEAFGVQIANFVDRNLELFNSLGVVTVTEQKNHN